MIVVDANILMYAYDSASKDHGPAIQWLQALLSGTASVGLPWQSIGAFLRIVTSPRLLRSPYSISEAAAEADRWLSQPNVRLLAPGDNYWAHLRELMIEGQVRGPMVSDAQLAALTIENGGILHTTDRDFARFPGLRWKNPLTAG